MAKIVCHGFLRKSPSSGGRGRWKMRWVELVDYRGEGGELRLEYSEIDKKKRKHLLGE